ncbi:MAG: DUF4296 domain-containing protein [Chitinophagaceae bacterium]
MKIFVIYLSLSIILFSCNKKEKVIPIQQMKFVMWDMITADAWMLKQFPSDTIIDSTQKNIALYNKIFSINKITKDAYYTSYNYYLSHPNEMKILLDSVSAYGVRKRDSITKSLK